MTNKKAVGSTSGRTCLEYFTFALVGRFKTLGAFPYALRVDAVDLLRAAGTVNVYVANFEAVCDHKSQW